MKNLIIVSLKLIFFIFLFLKKLSQSIYNYICLILIVINLKIILKKFMDSINLSEDQILDIYEIINLL